MGELHLKATFRRCRALTENLQDKPGAVDHLAADLFFQVALLDRRQSAIDDHQFGFVQFAIAGDALHLPFPEQGIGPHVAHRDDETVSHHDADGEGKTLRLLQTGGGILVAPLGADIRAHDKRPRTAGHFAFDIVIYYQSLSPSSPLSPRSSSVRSTGLSGWIVETACLYASCT